MLINHYFDDDSGSTPIGRLDLSGHTVCYFLVTPPEPHDSLCALALWIEDRKEWCQTLVSPTPPLCDCHVSGSTGAEQRREETRRFAEAIKNRLPSPDAVNREYQG